VADSLTKVCIFPTPEAMSRAAAKLIVEKIIAAVAQNGRFTMAVSGGSTPNIFYQMLAGEFTDVIPWDKIYLYWGDERYVSQRDPRSNFQNFHESLLKYVHIPLGNIHPMPTHREDPQDAATDYENFMRSQFDGPMPRFDVMLLGLGEDGHTASVFPGSPAIETDRWVMAVDTPAEPRLRLTMTLPVLSCASMVCFLVSGDKKAEVLKQVLSGPPEVRKHPAAGVRATFGRSYWFVDEAAGGLLEEGQHEGFVVERCKEDMGN